MSDAVADARPSEGSRRRVQHEMKDKKDALHTIRENGWTQLKAAKKLKLHPSTIRGWLQQGDAIRNTSPTPQQKRLSGSGRFSDTRAFEHLIVDTVMQQAKTGDKMSRSDIFSFCDAKIPGFAKKTVSARNSWMGRLLDRHKLRSHIKPFSTPRRLKGDENNAELTYATATDAVNSPTIIRDDNVDNTRIPTRAGSAPVFSVQAPPASIPTQPVTPAPALILQPVPSSILQTAESAALITEALGPPVHAVSTILDDGEDESDGGDSPVFVAFLPGKETTPSNPVIWSCKVPSYMVDSSDFPTVTVMASHLSCLKRGEWMENAIIDYYIHQHIPSSPICYNFDTQFFGHIYFESSQRRTKATVYESLRGLVPLFRWERFQFIQIPVQLNDHWSLIVVENAIETTPRKLTRFFHVDSLPGTHNVHAIASVLVDFFAGEKLSKTGKKHSKKYQTIVAEPSPKQTNSYDCGVYTLYFMERLNNFICGEEGEDLANRIKAVVNISRNVKELAILHEFRQSILYKLTNACTESLNV